MECRELSGILKSWNAEILAKCRHLIVKTQWNVVISDLNCNRNWDIMILVEFAAFNNSCPEFVLISS